MTVSSQSGRAWIVIPLVILAAVGLGAVTNYFVRREIGAPPTLKTGRQRLAVSARSLVPRESWRALVRDAMDASKRDQPGCSLDYHVLYRYHGEYVGLTVISWGGGEYTLDLYRYDPDGRTWIGCPRTGGGIVDEPDTARASELWGIPKAELDRWVADADKQVKRRLR